MPSQQEGGRVAEIRPLTGLRGLAALDVVLSHYNEEKLAALRWIEVHNPAVDLFFCLSAFTLCLTYRAGCGRAFGWRNYAAARFARIYPLYVAVLLLSAWYSRAYDFGYFHLYTHAGAIREFVRQALLVNSWPLVGTGVQWVDASWSVSIEAFCYVAVFPPLFLLSRPALRAVPTRLALVLMLLLSAGSYWFFVRFFQGAVTNHMPIPVPGRAVHWVGVVRGTTMFTAGWLAYLVWLRDDGIARAAGLAADALCVLFGLVLAGQVMGVVNANAVVLLMPAIVLGLVDPRSLAARLLSCRPMHFLGVISYSVYLLHRPVALLLLHDAPWLGEAEPLRIGVPLAATLVASVLCYYGFEAPMRAGLRRLLGCRLPARAATAALPG